MPGDRTLRYVYHFTFDDGVERSFVVTLDHATLALRDTPRSAPPPWTRLGYHQCDGCPLREEESPHCPVAVSVVDLVEFFRDRRSYDVVDVRVSGPAREYFRRLPLQQALSGLLGIYMVASGCPVFARMRPMLDTHLPFMTPEESSSRMMGMYLTAQFFLMRAGRTPDWTLEGFPSLMRRLRETNAAFCARLRSLGIGDASLNAVGTLNSLGELTTLILEGDDMERWQTLFLEQFG